MLSYFFNIFRIWKFIFFKRNLNFSIDVNVLYVKIFFIWKTFSNDTGMGKHGKLRFRKIIKNKIKYEKAHKERLILWWCGRFSMNIFRSPPLETLVGYVTTGEISQSKFPNGADFPSFVSVLSLPKRTSLRYHLFTMRIVTPRDNPHFGKIYKRFQIQFKF